MDITEEFVRELEEEYAIQSNKLKEARQKLQEKQKQDAILRCQKLEEELLQLENSAKEDRQHRLHLRDELLQKRNQQKTRTLETLKFQQQSWGLEREHQLEEAVEKKLKLTKLQRQKEKIDRMQLRMESELEEIELEKKNRSKTEAEILDRLLERGDVLKREMQDVNLYDQIKNQEEISEPIAGGALRLVDEIQPLRSRKLEEQAVHRQQELQKLNTKRTLLIEKEAQIRNERKEHEAMKSRGIDFMVEFKLGNAPPKEFILQNTIANEDDEESEEEDFNLDKLVKEANDFVNIGDTRLLDLKTGLEVAAKKDLPVLNTPFEYTGELGLNSYLISQRSSYYFVSKIVSDILQMVFDKIDKLPLLQELLLKENQWLIEKKSIDSIEEKRNFNKNLHILGTTILTEVIGELLTDIWNEVKHANNLAVSILTRSLFSSLSKHSIEFHSGVNEFATKFWKQIIASSFKEMKKNRLKKDEIAGEGLRTFSQTVENKGTPNMKVEEEVILKLVSCNDKKNLKNKDKKVYPNRQESLLDIIGDLNKDALSCKVGNLPSQVDYLKDKDSTVSIEKTYWKNITIKPLFVDYAPEALLPECTCVSLSQDCMKMALGSISGDILIYDLRKNSESETPILIHRAVSKSLSKLDKAKIIQIEWNTMKTSVFSLNTTGQALVWDLLPISESNEKSYSFRSKMLQENPKKFAPLSLVPKISFNTNDTKFPVVKIKGEEIEKQLHDDSLTSAIFFPSFSILGSQSNYMLCSSSGKIVKFNSNCGPENSKTNPIVFGNVKAKMEIPKPEGVKQNEGNNVSFYTFNANPNSIRREFFHFHKSSILFLGFIQHHSMNMVSVDDQNNLCIWNYDTSSFSGYGWFDTIKRFRLDWKFCDSNSKVKNGTIMQVNGTASMREIVFMIFYKNTVQMKSEKPTIRFFIFSLITFQFLMPTLEVAVVGSTSPRFAISPIFHTIESDYLVLLMNNTLSIYSLLTGHIVTRPINLIAQNLPARTIDSLSVGGNMDKFIILATGQSHKRVFRFVVSSLNVEQCKKICKSNINCGRAVNKRLASTSADFDIMFPSIPEKEY